MPLYGRSGLEARWRAPLVADVMVVAENLVGERCGTWSANPKGGPNVKPNGVRLLQGPRANESCGKSGRWPGLPRRYTAASRGHWGRREGRASALGMERAPRMKTWSIVRARATPREEGKWVRVLAGKARMQPPSRREGPRGHQGSMRDILKSPPTNSRAGQW